MVPLWVSLSWKLLNMCGFSTSWVVYSWESEAMFRAMATSTLRSIRAPLVLPRVARPRLDGELAPPPRDEADDMNMVVGRLELE